MKAEKVENPTTLDMVKPNLLNSSPPYFYLRQFGNPRLHSFTPSLLPLSRSMVKAFSKSFLLCHITPPVIDINHYLHKPYIFLPSTVTSAIDCIQSPILFPSLFLHYLSTPSHQAPSPRHSSTTSSISPSQSVASVFQASFTLSFTLRSLRKQSVSESRKGLHISRLL